MLMIMFVSVVVNSLSMVCWWCVRFVKCLKLVRLSVWWCFLFSVKFGLSCGVWWMCVVYYIRKVMVMLVVMI